jgi:hypothetical protein
MKLKLLFSSIIITTIIFFIPILSFGQESFQSQNSIFGAGDYNSYSGNVYVTENQASLSKNSASEGGGYVNESSLNSANTDSSNNTNNGGKGLRKLLGEIMAALEAFIPLVIGAGVLVFVWQVLREFFLEEDSKRKGSKGKEGINVAWWIIALAVMVFVWGFTAIVGSLFFGDNADTSVNLFKQDTDNLQKTPEMDAFPIAPENAETAIDIIDKIVEIIATIIPYMISLGALIFIWGMFNYLRTENVEKKAEASTYIAWGVFLLFIMIFMWAIVIMLGDSLKINNPEPGIQKINTGSLIVK